MSASADWRAFLIALPITSLVSSTSFAAIGFAASGEPFTAVDSSELLYVIGAYTLFMLPFVGVAGLILGLPVALALRRFHSANLPVLLLSGGIAGGLSSAVFLGGIALERTGATLLWAASIGLSPGITAAFIWWYFAERGSKINYVNA